MTTLVAFRAQDSVNATPKSMAQLYGGSLGELPLTGVRGMWYPQNQDPTVESVTWNSPIGLPHRGLPDAAAVSQFRITNPNRMGGTRKIRGLWEKQSPTVESVTLTTPKYPPHIDLDTSFMVPDVNVEIPCKSFFSLTFSFHQFAFQIFLAFF